MIRILSICFLLVFISCGGENNVSDATKTTSSKVNLDEFYEFYGRFHRDTAYQMAHITFPLEGQPSTEMEMNEGERFYWQKEDWVLHQPVDFEMSPYVRKISPINEELIVEYIVHEKLGYGMMRRFAKIGREWYLIYYAGMNPMVNG